MLCLVKNSGLLASVAGQVRPLVALGIPQWLTLSSGLLESDKYVLGPWETCATQDTGGSVCQPPAACEARPPTCWWPASSCGLPVSLLPSGVWPSFWD